MSSWSLALALAGGLAYAAASHALMLHAAAEPWAVAALLGPLLAFTALLAWRGRQWPLLCGVLVAAVFLAGIVSRGGVHELSLLYVLQHVGIHLALGASFAASLRGPGLSLIGRIASQVHGPGFTGEMAAYTRHVTVAWVIYFFGMAAASVWLYGAGSWQAWSILANFGTPAAMALLFVGEYLLRYRLHPEFERVSLMDAVRAYRCQAARR